MDDSGEAYFLRLEGDNPRLPPAVVGDCTRRTVSKLTLSSIWNPDSVPDLASVSVQRWICIRIFGWFSSQPVSRGQVME